VKGEKMSAYLKIGFLAGEHIESAVKEALKISIKWEMAVSFKFNGVCLMVYPESSAFAVMEQYREGMKDNLTEE